MVLMSYGFARISRLMSKIDAETTPEKIVRSLL